MDGMLIGRQDGGIWGDTTNCRTREKAQTLRNLTSDPFFLRPSKFLRNFFDRYFFPFSFELYLELRTR